jgi:two-component system sensor histidine kinase AlgZ
MAAQIAADDGLDRDPGFLPDFCSAAVVFGLVIFVALLAIVLVVAGQPAPGQLWSGLARVSLFLLWIALTAAAVLCYTRPRLEALGPRRGGMAALAVLAGVVGLVSAIAWMLSAWWAGRTGLPPDAVIRSGPGRFVAGNVIVGLIVGGAALRYFYVSQQWRRNVEMEARSRIRALQARIRPHFLFNSMNTIASLIPSSPDRAEEAIEDLSDLFRASLADAGSMIRLKEELEIAKGYERIESLRLGGRLRVDWDVADLPMRALIPGLSIQPLIENAIYHGIERLPEGGLVTVRGRRLDDHRVEVSVANPVPRKGTPASRTGHRIALENLRQRFEIAYGREGEVAIDDTDERYEVRLRFPEATEVS